MLTIDQVIIALEDGIRSSVRDETIRYLKDMKNLQEDYVILYDKYWREFNQQQENPPLTWDELRQMVGKPVWVEYFGRNRWIIPQEFRFDVIGREYILAQDGGMLFRFQQHEVWEAYRKERK